MVSKKHNPSFDLLRGSCLLGLVQLLARVMANTCQGVKKQGLQQKLRSTLNWCTPYSPHAALTAGLLTSSNGPRGSSWRASFSKWHAASSMQYGSSPCESPVSSTGLESQSMLSSSHSVSNDEARIKRAYFNQFSAAAGSWSRSSRVTGRCKHMTGSSTYKGTVTHVQLAVSSIQVTSSQRLPALLRNTKSLCAKQLAYTEVAHSTGCLTWSVSSWRSDPHSQTVDGIPCAIICSAVKNKATCSAVVSITPQNHIIVIWWRRLPKAAAWDLCLDVSWQEKAWPAVMNSKKIILFWTFCALFIPQPHNLTLICNHT